VPIRTRLCEFARAGAPREASSPVGQKVVDQNRNGEITLDELTQFLLEQ
jgi:hypothetical protein